MLAGNQITSEKATILTIFVLDKPTLDFLWRYPLTSLK